MRSNSIDRIIVGNNNPHNNNTLWVDTSNGEKNAVLKYKGYPIAGGGGSGGGGGSTGGASIVLPKSIGWEFAAATVVYSEWPKSGDILLVPYYPETDGVKRLLPFLINAIDPESDLPSEEPLDGPSIGAASLLGSFVEEGSTTDMVNIAINGDNAGWHLGIERDTEGFKLHIYSIRG